MTWLACSAGAGIILLILVDIFRTILHHGDTGPLSGRSNRLIWRALRWASLLLPRFRDAILGVAGPVMVVITVGVWVVSLVLGFALIVWPALGTGIQDTGGATSTDFATAVYFSGYALTTLGTGDIVAETAPYQLLMVIEAGLGFSVLTMALTYVLAVYGAIISRNTFALALHHGAGGHYDAAELVARLGPGGDFSQSRTELTSLATGLLELVDLHRSYPILPYFRFREPFHALPGMMMVMMDTVSLILSTLNEEEYRALTDSAVVAQLWGGGMEMLREISTSLLSAQAVVTVARPTSDDMDVWRDRYRRALARLALVGITPIHDVAAGEERYVCLRGEWAPMVAAWERMLLHDRGA